MRVVKITIHYVGGPHTMSKTIKTSSLGLGLAAFAKKKSTCIGCKAILDDDSKLKLFIMHYTQGTYSITVQSN